MVQRSLIAITALALVFCPGAARSQEADDLTEGVRVRVTAPPLGLYGETGRVDLAGRGGMIVVLDDGERLRLPYPALAHVEISRGKKRATALGALAGAMMGVTAAVLSSEPSWDEWSEHAYDGVDEGTVFLGAIAGASIGALIGSAITYEAWRPVPWFHFAGNDGEYGVGLAIRTRLDPAR